MEPAELLASTVDKSQVPPLHQKRIVAFINHFIINTCSFLNEFANQCETKFIELERKMQRLEVALSIIESKLASIPNDNTTVNSTAESTVKPVESAVEPVETATTVKNNPDETSAEAESTTSNTSIETSAVRACEDTRYKKFFKMVQFGVPAVAVKLKMQAEGMDPNILDTPNLELPDGVKS